jgi:hypothetical protein
MFKTLQTNWRDICAFLVISIFACAALDLLTQWSARMDESGHDIPGLATFISLLTGFCRFAGANLCAWLLGIAVAWPVLNRWSNNSDLYLATWHGLEREHKMWIYVAVSCAELIGACICFAL